MAKKKLLKIGVCLFLLVMIVYTIFGFNPIKPGNMTLSFDVEMNDEEGNSIPVYSKETTDYVINLMKDVVQDQ